MTKPKFDEFDRERTVKEVERRLGVKLSRSGTRRKYFVDESKKPYIVIGAYEEWSGIPKIILDDMPQIGDGTLIFAERRERKIRIFCGPIMALANHRKRLYATEKDYQFEVVTKGDFAIVKGFPEIRLDFLSEIEYSSENKQSDISSK